MVGNQKAETFLMVEFEEGCSDSIFAVNGTKSTKEWSPTFEHGFSQLVDWFCALDDHRHTKDFGDDFGYGYVKFQGLLVVGRSADISSIADRRRLRWREEYVRIGPQNVNCVTYDELYEQIKQRLSNYAVGSAIQ